MLNIKLIAVVIAVLGLAGLGVWSSRGYYAPRIALAEHQAGEAQAQTHAIQHARTVEHAIAASDTASTTTYINEVQHDNEKLALANAALSARLDRLRNRAATRTGDLPAVAAAPAGSDGSVYASLSAEQRVQFIDAISQFGRAEYANAGDADTVSTRLTACQNDLLTRSATQ